MSDRIREHHKAAIATLPKKLRELAQEIESGAHSRDQSFHDEMCDWHERNPEEFTDKQREMVLTAMGSYWD